MFSSNFDRGPPEFQPDAILPEECWCCWCQWRVDFKLWCGGRTSPHRL